MNEKYFLEVCHSSPYAIIIKLFKKGKLNLDNAREDLNISTDVAGIYGYFDTIPDDEDAVHHWVIDVFANKEEVTENITDMIVNTLVSNKLCTIPVSILTKERLPSKEGEFILKDFGKVYVFNEENN